MYKLELFLPEEYPMAPPKVRRAAAWRRSASADAFARSQVRFLTKIYHPNVDKVRGGGAGCAWLTGGR